MYCYKVKFDLTERGDQSAGSRQGAIYVWANSSTDAQELVQLMFKGLECKVQLGKLVLNAPIAQK